MIRRDIQSFSALLLAWATAFAVVACGEPQDTAFLLAAGQGSSDSATPVAEVDPVTNTQDGGCPDPNRPREDPTKPPKASDPGFDAFVRRFPLTVYQSEFQGTLLIHAEAFEKQEIGQQELITDRAFLGERWFAVNLEGDGKAYQLNKMGEASTRQFGRVIEARYTFQGMGGKRIKLEQNEDVLQVTSTEFRHFFDKVDDETKSRRLSQIVFERLPNTRKATLLVELEDGDIIYIDRRKYYDGSYGSRFYLDQGFRMFRGTPGRMEEIEIQWGATTGGQPVRLKTSVGTFFFKRTGPQGNVKFEDTFGPEKGKKVPGVGVWVIASDAWAKKKAEELQIDYEPDCLVIPDL